MTGVFLFFFIINFNKSIPSLSGLSNLMSTIAKSGIRLLISKTA